MKGHQLWTVAKGTSARVVGIALLAALAQIARAQQPASEQTSSAPANANSANIPPVASQIHAQARAPRPLTPERRKHLEDEIASLRMKLEEYRKGERSDSDGFVIMFRMMRDFESLGIHTAQSKERQEIYREWLALKKKHPEFKDPGMLSEEVAAQQAARDQAVEQNRELEEQLKKPFVPKDSRAFGPYGYGDQAVFVYQYRIEFCRLPDDIENATAPQNHHATMQLYRDGKRLHAHSCQDIGTMPTKVLTFRHKIQIADLGFKFPSFIFVCDDLLGHYEGSDADETRTLLGRYPGSYGAVSWLNKSGQYEEFCGAVSLTGKILYQLPFKQHVPDTLVELGPMNRDGSSVELKVGRLVKGKTSPDAEDVPPNKTFVYIGNFRKTLIYTYPDRLESYGVSDTAALSNALKQHGF